MTTLASVDDIEAVVGQTVDTARVTRLIELASALVERRCRRRFARVEGDQVAVLVTDGSLRLPDGPIEAVTAVVDPDGATVDPDDYEVSGAHLTGRTWACGEHLITYTHGYDPIPDDVVAVVTASVARVIAGPGPQVQSESLGDWAAAYTPSPGGLWLSGDDITALAPYRRAVFSVPMVR